MGWEQFAYSKLDFKDSAMRPYIRVLLTNPNTGKRFSLLALIDSGARRTIVEQGIASALGLKMADCQKTTISGLTGECEGHECNLNLSFNNFPGKTYDSPVVFAKMLYMDMVLGEEFFFKNFKVLFDGDETFKLRPIIRL